MDRNRLIQPTVIFAPISMMGVAKHRVPDIYLSPGPLSRTPRLHCAPSTVRRCSGHNIIPTTHRRNEPFIAALLGCCFLSQASAPSPPPPLLTAAAPAPSPFGRLPPSPSLSRPSRTHAQPLSSIALRYVALRCLHASRRCTCAPGVAFAPRRVSRKFRGNLTRRR